MVLISGNTLGSIGTFLFGPGVPPPSGVSGGNFTAALLYPQAPWLYNASQNLFFNETYLQLYIAILNLTNGTNGINGTDANITSVTWDNGVFNMSWNTGQWYISPNLTGPQGIQGIQGTNGTNGADGVDGINGLNGTNGINGSNLTMLSITNEGNGSYTWHFSDGTNYTTGNLTGAPGIAGTDGLNGTNGINGSNLTMLLITNEGNGSYTWYFSDGTNYTTGNLTGAIGPQGIQGLSGINGTNGINGSNGTSFDVGGGYLYNNGSNVIFFNETKNNETIIIVGIVYNDSNAINNLNVTFINQNIVTREPTGISDIDRIATTLSFNTTTRSFTMVGTYTVYINGTKYNRTNDSLIIANTTAMNYIYYIDGTMRQSVIPWQFESTAQTATVYWNKELQQGLVGDERHGIAMDWRTHEYLHESIGARYVSGFTGTFTNTAFNITAGEFYDDDNEFLIGTQNTCEVIYRNGSTSTWLYNQTQYYYKNATNMYYDNNGALVAVPINQYMAIWFFVTNDKDVPIYCILGQRLDTTLANAIANNVPSTLSFGSLPVAELKSLYRVIIRNDATPYESTGTVDYRMVSQVASGNYVATSHGTLTGLTADDHPQYLLVDGTRTLIANWFADKNITFADGNGINASAVLNPYWLLYSNSTYLFDINHVIYFNETKLNETIQSLNRDKNVSGPYLSNDSTTIYFNETKLNETIINISDIRSYSTNVTITVTGGIGIAESSMLNYLITQITVYTPDSMSYRFEANESLTGDVVDRDREIHNGIWDIYKSHSLNSNVTVRVFDAVTDGTYTVRIKYVDNAIQI